MSIDDWSTDEAQNASLGKYDVSRGECPDASTSEHARELMANIKALSDSVDERFENFVGENIEVDGVSIVNNDGTLTVVDVALDGDTEELLTDKIAEIEAAAETASGKADDAAAAAGQAADSATEAVGAVSDAVDAANLAAAQAVQAVDAAARAQAGAALAESVAQAVVEHSNLNWQKTGKAGSVEFYPVPKIHIYPVVEFKFSEILPTDGDKAPDNPSTITGVGEVFVGHESENYAPPENLKTTTSNAFTVASDGWVTLDYTNSNEYGASINSNAVTLQFSYNPSETIDLSKSYSISFYLDEKSSSFLSTPPAYQPGVAWYVNIGGDASGSQLAMSSAINFNSRDAALGLYTGVARATGTANPGKLCQVTFTCRAQTVTHCRFRVSVVESSATTEIAFGDTFYGGSVDLSTGVMAVTHMMVEPDSLSYDISGHPADADDFEYTDSFGREITTDGNTLTISDATGGKVVYKLAVQEFASLTPIQLISLAQPDKYTPKLNAVYTDAKSVCVGYPKSPIRTEYELTQAIIATEGGE